MFFKAQKSHRYLLGMLVLLAGVVLAPFRHTTAQAATPVSEINLTDVDLNPVVGQAPSTSYSCTSPAIASAQLVWKDTNNDYAVVTSAWEVGMSPNLFITVTLKEGYEIASDFVLKVNGDPYGHHNLNTNIPFGTLKAQVPDTIEISGLDLTHTVGTKLDTEFTVNSTHLNVSCEWKDANTDYSLDYARYYTKPEVKIRLTPKDGYVFTASPKLKINGTSVSSTYTGNTLKYDEAFEDLGNPPASKTVSVVNVTVPGIDNIVVGQAPDLSFTCDNSHVNVRIAVLDQNDGEKVITKYAVGQCPSYFVYVTVGPDWGFSSDAEIWVNDESRTTVVYPNYWGRRTNIAGHDLYLNDIEKVNVSGFHVPVNGNTAVATLTTDNANVQNATLVWKDKVTDGEVSKFVGGHTYYGELTLTAKSGHGFNRQALVKALENSMTVEQWKGQTKFTLGADQTTLTARTKDYVLPVDTISSVALQVPEPVVGKAPTLTGEGWGYTYSIHYYDNLNNTPTTFVEGELYWAEVEVNADEGFTFSDGVCSTAAGTNANVTINGKPVHVNSAIPTSHFTAEVHFACTHKYDAGKITKAPGCETEGVKTFICAICHGTRTESVAATGHNYGSAVYEWSADHKTCIAKKVCKNDSSHVISETATATSVVKTPAAAGKKGITTYTAVFKNTAFQKQTIDVEDIAAPGSTKADKIAEEYKDAPIASGVKNPKKGGKVKDKTGGAYLITATGKSKTVTYMGCIKKGAKKVTIPADLKIGGKKYKVTAITSQCFAGNVTITSIVIGKNIKKIEKSAFEDCANLKKITIKTTKLTKKTVGANAFKGLHPKAACKVPAGKLSAYKTLLKSRGVKGKKQKIKA